MAKLANRVKAVCAVLIRRQGPRRPLLFLWENLAGKFLAGAPASLVDSAPFLVYDIERKRGI